MEEQKRKGIKVKDLISIIFIVILVMFGHNFYDKYNFNEYIKAEGNLGVSKFVRDKNEKVSNYSSYKIENPDYNDAVFYKTVDVNPNTSYRVSCKIKTENVVTQKENSDSGAHICITTSDEKSDNVIGTTDWKEVSFYFNSKNRKQVDIGFRLGGYEGNCKGTAWFSDFKMESGIIDTSNKWNFLCLLFDTTDVNITQDGITQNVKLNLTEIDKDDMSVCMKRFKNSMEELSNRKN